MKLTLIGLFIIIIIMLLVQISFRDNFSIINQKAFREDQVNYNLKHLTKIDSDGKEIECGKLNNDSISRNLVCEGFTSVDQSKYAEAAEKCSIVNGIADWRVRANRIPLAVIDETKGCGFCFDTKNVYYGDENGPFKNVGPTVCNNWIKPGSSGGTHHEKNIFAAYPFEDDVYKEKKNKEMRFGQGVVKDTVKMYEQELCREMKNCGDQNIMGADGTAMCGWCATGRKGDGVGEGMVRKGGTGADQNETKYDDDFCHWPREINAQGQKTYLYKKETKDLKKWKKNKGKEFIITIGDLSGTTIILDNPGRLMNGLKHCAASNNLFPCFPNFTGNIVNKDGKIEHSKKCYDEIWNNYAEYNGIKCDGDIKERLDANFSSSTTFKSWDKTFIPSVESAVQKIPERIQTSAQYNKNYKPEKVPEPEKNSVGWYAQWVFSALQNSKACTGNSPALDPCDDKYRSREYNFFRPKECIDNIIFSIIPVMENRNVIFEKYFKTDPRYIPDNNLTHKYYWAVKNDIEWREGIHFDWSNEKLKKKLEEKWSDLIKKNSCKTQGNVNEQYDKALVAVKYLLGTEHPGMDIIEELGVKLWQDDDGGTSGVWIKMCWEDFRLELKKLWANKDHSFINKNGNINLTGFDDIKNKIIDDSKFYHRVLSYKDISTGLNIPVEINDENGNPGYITKENYEHKYFPFWRLWKGNTDYYITSKYLSVIQTKERIKLREEKKKRKNKNKNAFNLYKNSLLN